MRWSLFVASDTIHSNAGIVIPQSRVIHQNVKRVIEDMIKVGATPVVIQTALFNNVGIPRSMLPSVTGVYSG